MIDRDLRVLAGELGAALRAAGCLCVTAESCTGGLLAGAMTSCPGSSQWFERGFVTYSNAAKIEQLRVSLDTLERYGAVSEETAMEMASGALGAVPSARLALATTGIAGPGGATPGKPVGMVCFGIARRVGAGITTRGVTRVFEGDREAIRLAAVRFALQAALDDLGRGA
ncbi:nicotinamide-nucleotide amidohydrolase family protein [Castellaniella sp.]|uniref:CinA family protein n=1 Tax=Castellaniella sp. TaxID=1955812 RepID=UPI002AFEB3EB|nr:nicotinamide-nucleotide amidohydrolase family protein [Castellaniella sp.]